MNRTPTGCPATASILSHKSVTPTVRSRLSIGIGSHGTPFTHDEFFLPHTVVEPRKYRRSPGMCGISCVIPHHVDFFSDVLCKMLQSIVLSPSMNNNIPMIPNANSAADGAAAYRAYRLAAAALADSTVILPAQRCATRTQRQCRGTTWSGRSFGAPPITSILEVSQ